MISTYRKTYTDATGKNFYFEQVREDGMIRRVDPDYQGLIKFLDEFEIVEVPYIAPVDNRTDEEKRLAEYQTELDPILAKIQFYEMEYDLEDDNTRKQEIKRDILDVLKADWKAKKKAIRAKYPTGLWKPSAGGQA